jgi:hypothetical protein
LFLFPQHLFVLILFGVASRFVYSDLLLQLCIVITNDIIELIDLTSLLHECRVVPVVLRFIVALILKFAIELIFMVESKLIIGFSELSHTCIKAL